ncbi:unnamed protein product [Effrenium voratum]|nr:unnamed protein product [Effrenium voratum]
MAHALLRLIVLGGALAAENCVENEDFSVLQMQGQSSRHGSELQARWRGLGKVLAPAEVKSLEHPKKWHGVNYGHRFLPEDWIKVPRDFFESIPKFGPRSALWDLQGAGAKDHMLGWLNETIQEAHFEDMKHMGVEVLRVPVGYWNFVTYPGDEGPEAPPQFKEQFKNLHRIATPEEYKPYFDRLFDFAGRHGVKVLLDLHGLPGSQNGEIHSGACTAEDGSGQEVFFQNWANRQKAVEAVRAMAAYGKDKEALWGIQVINEPHLHSSDEHDFLKSYYQDACKAVRESLPEEKPCVVFTWTYNMQKWLDEPSNPLPEETYGQVIFDTHLYHFPGAEGWTSENDGLEQAKMAYSEDLRQCRLFYRHGGHRLLIGEWTLAGPTLNEEESRQWTEWLVDEFDFAGEGSLMWTYDNQSPEWSMSAVAKVWNVQWPHLFDPERQSCTYGGRVAIQNADTKNYLSAKPAIFLKAGSAQLSGQMLMEVRQAWSQSSWEQFTASILQDGESQIVEVKTFHDSVLGSAGGQPQGLPANGLPTVWVVGMQPITVRLNTAPQRVQQIEVDELPIGEPSTGFSLEVFVDIITPFGATTTKTIQVFSLPPKNATEIILRKLDDARTSDPETAINTLMTILNIAQAPSLPPGQQPSPELTAILTQVRDVMITNTNEAPVTINTAVNQAVVINGIIDAGMKDDETSMNVLEDMVQNYANAGLYNVNDPSLIEASLYALGNILPNSGAETALAATGNSLGMSKYQNTRGETFEYTTVEHEDEIMASHVLSTFSGRLPQNHPLPYRDERVIDTCQSAYCDMVWLMCIHMENRKAYKFMCCDSPNPRTNCEHPPCWFYGPRCPVDETSAASAAAAPAVASALASARRLNETERKLQFATTTTPAPALSGAGALIWNLEQDELPVLLDVQQAIEQQDRLAEANLRAAAQVEAYWPDDDQWLPAEVAGILEDGLSITWEDGSVSEVPADYVRKVQEVSEIPDGAEAKAADDMDALLAAAEAAGATAQAEDFVGDSRPPCGLFWSDALTKPPAERLESAEEERKRLRPTGLMSSEDARRMAMAKKSNPSPSSAWKASYALMSAFERDRKRQEATLAEENSVRAKKEDERQVSQLITRAAVLRDTICKQVIVQLTTGAPPMRFVTPGFVLYMGRTRNMSQVSPVFVFPEKFAVPPTAGNTPTPGSNVTAFSFIFVEYVKNIYGWSDSAPPGNLNLPRIITLLVMRASTIEIEVRYETFPIRVFADQTISSSGLCLYWDRFAPDTSGGAWSPQGLLNNGDGCLTTHLSDIGLFVDGRPAKLLEVDRAISYYIDEVVDVGTNYSQMAILGFILLLGTFCALPGSKMPKVFSRPQRILCLGVLATGVMAVNAIIYGNPSGIVSGDQFIASGVLSALVAFPLFCAVTFMFQTRPTPAKKRLVKKSANADQMETIAKVRREIEAKSTLAPPPGYLNLPALPPAPGSVVGGAGDLFRLNASRLKAFGPFLTSPAALAMPKEVEGENQAALDTDLSLSALFKVEGKVVLVSGGGSGIGAMIAAGFVQNGCKVYIASRKDTSKYAAELTAKGPGSCTALVCDISKYDQQQGLIDAIQKAEGKLHILVNNSGTNFNAPLEKYTPEAFEKVMQLNTNALFALTRLALPLLESSSSHEDPARVIHIASVNGLQPPLIDTFAYSASKAAVVMLSKHLAGALGPKHITSNCICPGPFMSRMMRGTVSVVGEDNISSTTALSRMGLPADIAGACLFLCSRAGAYVTGTDFALDGGSLVCRAPKSSQFGPPQPRLPMAQLPGMPGLPALPGLPPLPTLKAANPALGTLPPPPKYPQPPARGMRNSGSGPAQAALTAPPPPPGGRTLSNPSLPGLRAVEGASPGVPGMDREALPNMPGIVAEAQHQAADEAEEAAGTARRLQPEASHGMAPGQPPLPPLSGPPPPPKGARTPTGGMTPTGGATPMGHTPAGSTYNTPRTPPPLSANTPGTGDFLPPALPKEMPPMPTQPQGVTRGVVHRGDAPTFIPVPFKGPPGRPGLPPGMPSLPPGRPGAKGGVPPPPPPPPPPPREDDPTFVRRVRLAYIDRAAKSHAQLLQDEGQETLAGLLRSGSTK